MQTLPTSLYIHLPWCLAKCPYCDFHSLAASSFPEEAYTNAILQDLEAVVASHGARPLLSIFFGGGTPSLFSPSSIARMIDAACRYFPVDKDCEITLEANPGTFEQQKWQDFQRAGVNRLSIGVQSFNDAFLKKLGRIHCGDEARKAVATALDIFPEVNIDLMYGLPGQSLRDFSQDLETAMRFSPPHLSYYQLTLEPHTVFGNHPPKLPLDENIAMMEESLYQTMDAAGYERYEISNYAKKGHQCRHNYNYWTFGDYFGVGAGAHGKLTTGQTVRREIRLKNPKTYIDRAEKISESIYPEEQTLAFEFMLNALRLQAGVPASFFQARTGIPLEALALQIGKAQGLGLLAKTPDRIQATERGFCLLNDLLWVLFPD